MKRKEFNVELSKDAADVTRPEARKKLSKRVASAWGREGKSEGYSIVIIEPERSGAMVKNQSCWKIEET